MGFHREKVVQNTWIVLYSTQLPKLLRLRALMFLSFSFRRLLLPTSAAEPERETQERAPDQYADGDQ